MININSMIHLQLVLFVLILLGVYARKRGFITPSSRKSITDVFINIILPCNIIQSFLIDWSSEIFHKSITILCVAFAAQALYYLFSKLFYPRVAKEKKVILQYATICSNAGFMGNPIVEAVFGSEGLLYASIALIPLRIFMWSAGLSLFTETSGKKIVRSVMTHPCIVAVYIGFALMISGFQLPSFLLTSIKMVSNCNMAISMLVIGSILAEINRKDVLNRLLLYYSFLRLIFIPLIIFGILKLLHMNELIIGVTVLLAAMPAGSTTAMLAEKYNADAKFASACVFISTLFSLLTLPLISFLL